MQSAKCKIPPNFDLEMVNVGDVRWATVQYADWEWVDSNLQIEPILRFAFCIWHSFSVVASATPDPFRHITPGFASLHPGLNSSAIFDGWISLSVILNPGTNDGEGKRVRKVEYVGGLIQRETVFVYSAGKLVKVREMVNSEEEAEPQPPIPIPFKTP